MYISRPFGSSFAQVNDGSLNGSPPPPPELHRENTPCMRTRDHEVPAYKLQCLMQLNDNSLAGLNNTRTQLHYQVKFNNFHCLFSLQHCSFLSRDSVSASSLSFARWASCPEWWLRLVSNAGKKAERDLSYCRQNWTDLNALSLMRNGDVNQSNDINGGLISMLMTSCW